MADVKISALPAATTPLAGTEVLPIVQGRATDQVSVANLTAGRVVAAAGLTVDANTSGNAVRITQTGAGNALVVEDSTNPDSTPFVVNADGNIILGNTAVVENANPATGAVTTAVLQLAASNIPTGMIGSTIYNGSNTTIAAPYLSLGRSNTSTFGGDGIVASGDLLGGVQFHGNDGTNQVRAAQIQAFVDGTPGANDMPGRLVFSTTADGASSPTERMRINSAGNVGIGTASPSAKLDVTGAIGAVQVNSNGDQLGFTYNGFNYITASGASATLQIQASGAAGKLILASGGSERMRIDSSGNVGIGTSAPVNKLDVTGSFGRGAPVTKTGDFTLGATENWIICNGTGSITVTLPAASSWTGREVMIKTIAAQTVVSASSNVVPLAGGAAGTAILAAAAGNWATLVSDGTNWIIMQG